MATQSEIQILTGGTGQISQAAKQIESARGQIEKIPTAQIIATAQQLRQTGPSPLQAMAGRQQQEVARQQRIEFKGQAIKQVEQAEKELKDFLSTPSGRLAYAKEFGVRGTPITGYVTGFGRKGEAQQLLGYKYQTPYGTVDDLSIQQEKLGSEYQALAKSYGYKSVPELQKSLEFSEYIGGGKGEIITPVGVPLGAEIPQLKATVTTVGPQYLAPKAPTPLPTAYQNLISTQIAVQAPFATPPKPKIFVPSPGEIQPYKAPSFGEKFAQDVLTLRELGRRSVAGAKEGFISSFGTIERGVEKISGAAGKAGEKFQLKYGKPFYYAGDEIAQKVTGRFETPTPDKSITTPRLIGGGFRIEPRIISVEEQAKQTGELVRGGVKLAGQIIPFSIPVVSQLYTGGGILSGLESRSEAKAALANAKDLYITESQGYTPSQVKDYNKKVDEYIAGLKSQMKLGITQAALFGLPVVAPFVAKPFISKVTELKTFPSDITSLKQLKTGIKEGIISPTTIYQITNPLREAIAKVGGKTGIKQLQKLGEPWYSSTTDFANAKLVNKASEWLKKQGYAEEEISKMIKTDLPHTQFSYNEFAKTKLLTDELKAQIKSRLGYIPKDLKIQIPTSGTVTRTLEAIREPVVTKVTATREGTVITVGDKSIVAFPTEPSTILRAKSLTVYEQRPVIQESQAYLAFEASKAPKWLREAPALSKEPVVSLGEIFTVKKGKEVSRDIRTWYQFKPGEYKPEISAKGDIVFGKEPTTILGLPAEKGEIATFAFKTVEVPQEPIRVGGIMVKRPSIKLTEVTPTGIAPAVEEAVPMYQPITTKPSMFYPSKVIGSEPVAVRGVKAAYYKYKTPTSELDSFFIAPGGEKQFVREIIPKFLEAPKARDMFKIKKGVAPSETFATFKAEEVITPRGGMIKTREVTAPGKVRQEIFITKYAQQVSKGEIIPKFTKFFGVKPMKPLSEGLTIAKKVSTYKSVVGKAKAGGRTITVDQALKISGEIAPQIAPPVVVSRAMTISGVTIRPSVGAGFISVPALRVSPRTLQIQPSVSAQVQPQVQRQPQMQPQFQIPSLAQVPSEVQMPAQFQFITPVQAQVPAQIQEPKITPRIVTPTPIITQKPIPPKIEIPKIEPPKYQKPERKLTKKKEFLESLYIPEVKRRGKFVQVGLPSVKAKAIRRGEFITRQTAAATFRVVPTKAKARVGVSEVYKPSPLVFRSYAIKKGRAIPLKDVFIQRKVKRIGTAGEKAEITRLGISARKIRSRGKSIW